MKLEEHIISNPSGEYSREVWYLPCSGQAQKICIFLDGEHYVKHMEAVSILIDIQAQQLIPPVECLFVSHVDSAARQEDFICNPRYASFIARDLMAWVEERSGLLSMDRNHLIAGTSLSGLAAAYTSLHYPQTFEFTLSQSGSLWWNQEWLTGELPKIPAAKGQYWISVGDKETDSGISHPPTGLRQDVDQITACRRFSDALGQRGNLVRYHLYEGGHDPWLGIQNFPLPYNGCWLEQSDEARPTGSQP